DLLRRHVARRDGSGTRLCGGCARGPRPAALFATGRSARVAPAPVWRASRDGGLVRPRGPVTKEGTMPGNVMILADAKVGEGKVLVFPRMSTCTALIATVGDTLVG